MSLEHISQIEFTTSQMELLNTMMTNKIKECLTAIDDDDFDGDLDSFQNLYQRVLNFDQITVVDNPINTKKKSRKKTKTSTVKRTKTPYINWLWNSDEDIGMSKIKSQNPELTHKQCMSEAGKIWKQMTTEEKLKYKITTTHNQDNHLETEENHIESEDNCDSGDDVDSEDEEVVIENNVGKVNEMKEDVEGMKMVSDKYYSGYTSKTGKKEFDTFESALSQYENDEEATGILKNKNGKYTIRKGKKLLNTIKKNQPEKLWYKL
tara:strand:+ start:150 stop:941 length:792 start_codon:yes stop_codon:yes gene_type:complete